MISNQTSTVEQTFLPKVSVIIPVFNGERDLPELIDCLYKQSYPQELVEYLLVDNNSSDRTAQIVQAAAKEAVSKRISIHYLSENKIQSSYAARNAGIRFSSGEIICFTDVDCRPEADWVAALIKPFAESCVMVVGGAIAALSGITLMEKYAERKNLLSHKASLSHYFCPYGQTANLAVRRQALEKVGLFRPYLTTGGDADICWRIQQKSSCTIRCAEKAVVRHRHRKTLRGLLKQWKRYGKSHQYLSQLYQIERKNDAFWNRKQYFLCWRDWLLHQFPRLSIRVIFRKATLLDLLTRPIDLLTIQARISEKRKTKLPEQAYQIEWLSQSQNKLEVNKDISLKVP